MASPATSGEATPEPAVDQIVTLFRSRLKPTAGDEYEETADAMLDGRGACPASSTSRRSRLMTANACR